MTTAKFLLPLAASAVLLGACTVGPDFKAPEANTPATWHDALATQSALSGESRVTAEADPDPQWWRSFNDATLTSLIDRATRGNLDVQIAVVRIAEARASERSAAAAGLPTLSASASYTHEDVGQGLASTGSTAPPGGNPGLAGLIDSLTKPVNIYQGSLDASWELDLFGRVRRSVEAANASTVAAIGNRDDALVTLQAEVAQTYAQLRAAQASRDTAQADLVAEQQILELTRERAAKGLVTDLDVESATSAVGTLEASLAQYDQQIAASLNGLAVLLGEAPGALDAELATATPIPPPPPQVPVGLPSSLARRRPDIRVAEAQLHRQTAQVGVAVAQFYPDISLTGQVGQESTKPGDLTKWANNFYSFGPSVSLPIFQGGQLRANLKLAKADQAEAALSYRKTVLEALQDVDNALSAYRAELRRHQALEKTVSAETKALALATNQYRSGVSTFIDVLTAENTLAQQRQQFIQSTLTLTTDVVTLYKALGGGWQQQEGVKS
ncbi:efflux transporter outer membrane subunit [Paraburkholderia acidicola]|uniref:Efflux transporter outer membrane subunit n=1 Tax=Paraburkholderia acidicola TaxID=1912599 RepID=A0ABV1LWM1_9BURK